MPNVRAERMGYGDIPNRTLGARAPAPPEPNHIRTFGPLSRTPCMSAQPNLRPRVYFREYFLGFLGFLALSPSYEYFLAFLAFLGFLGFLAFLAFWDRTVYIAKKPLSRVLGSSLCNGV